MHATLSLRILSVVIALSLHAVAQTTWVVGSGGSFLVVQHAIDSPLVQPGDVLQIVPGPLPHEGFHLDKALTIRGPATIQGDAMFSGAFPTTIAVTTGHAQLIDLTFKPPTGTPYLHGVTVRQGLVSFDNCALEAALLTKNGSRVTLNHCTVHSPSQVSAMRIESGSFVAATQTTVTAATSRGIENWGSFQGQRLIVNVASAIPVAASGSTWIADSALMISGFAGPISTYPNTFFARISTNAWFVNTNMTAPLFGVSFVQAEPQIGMPYDMEVRGVPATAVLVELTLGLQAGVTGGSPEPTWMLGQVSFPLVAVTTDATGQATLPLVIPMIPALRGLSIWAHATANFSGLHRSPPAGGLIR